MEPQESLGKRLRRFVTLMGGLAAVTGTAVVLQRLSQDTLALLVGLTCGVLAMVPTLALGLWVWRREDARRQEGMARQGYAASATPPVIVVTPQALPGMGQPTLGDSRSATWSWNPSAQERTFTIVGGDE